MGVCKYCGQKAGWFSHAHEGCEHKYQSVLQNMMSLTTPSKRTGQGLDTLENRLSQMAKEHFIAAGQVKTMMIGGWEQALNQVLQDNVLSEGEENILMEFAKHFNLSQEDLNRNGAYTRLVKSSV